MQLEINVTGNKVRFLVNGRLSRWYNGTEFAAIRNLVRSAEQVEAWIEQEEIKNQAVIEQAAKSIAEKYNKERLENLRLEIEHSKKL